jgi:hypothetical protein
MVCAAVVCSVLEARWERILEHSHDFDLVFEDARREPLEVSAFTREDVERRWHQTPEPIPSQALKESWAIRVAGWADLSTIQIEAEPNLVVLESHGITTYFAGDHYGLFLFPSFPEAPTMQTLIARVPQRANA